MIEKSKETLASLSALLGSLVLFICLVLMSILDINLVEIKKPLENSTGLSCSLQPLLPEPEVKLVEKPVVKTVYRVVVRPRKVVERKNSRETALEVLSNQYAHQLGLSQKEALKVLRLISLRSEIHTPCQSWKLKGKLLKGCKALSFEEAGHYAINAKLIPCAGSTQELVDCYL